jgi:hypothetical protein
MTAAVATQGALFRQTTVLACEPVSARWSEVDRARSDLFVEFIRGMNASGLPYCLLSGYESYPLVLGSDVDFMVRPEDSLRIAPLLRDIAARCDALLVQAIRHETSACYYALAKQAGHEVAYLHPDCTTDYRRNGRLWLVAEEVISDRRRLGAFFVPAVADEFQYYLIKKALKGQIKGTEFQRIAGLYLSSPEECSQRMRRLWTKETIETVASALVRYDLQWMQLHLSDLLDELLRSTPRENRRLRTVQLFREWRRRVSRVARPTGLVVRVCGGNTLQRSELAAALERNLRPAFRRTKIIAEERSRRLPVSVLGFIPKVKSTLIVRRSPVATHRWHATNEISSDLSEKGHLTVETATRFVLETMAKRVYLA